MSFDFERTNVQWASIDSSPITAYPFAVSVHFKPETATGVTQGLVYLGDKDSSTNYSVVGIDTSGQPSAFSRSSAQGTATSAAVVSVGTYVNIICIFNAANDRTVYVNNDAGVQNTTSHTDVVNTYDRIGLGRFLDSSPSDAADGLIAQVGVWNRALNGTERTQLQTEPPGNISSGLVALYAMTVNESPISDGSAGGTFDLTLQGTTGTPTFSADDPTLGGGAGQAARTSSFMRMMQTAGGGF